MYETIQEKIIQEISIVFSCPIGFPNSLFSLAQTDYKNCTFAAITLVLTRNVQRRIKYSIII